MKLILIDFHSQSEFPLYLLVCHVHGLALRAASYNGGRLTPRSRRTMRSLGAFRQPIPAKRGPLRTKTNLPFLKTTLIRSLSSALRKERIVG